MLTLPTWLAIYLSTGILFTYGCSCIPAFNKAYRAGYRARTGREPGAIACTFIALTCIAVWPIWASVFAVGAVCGMARVMRDAPYPHASLHGGYQPRATGKDRGSPPSGGSAARRPKR